MHSSVIQELKGREKLRLSGASSASRLHRSKRERFEIHRDKSAENVPVVLLAAYRPIENK